MLNKFQPLNEEDVVILLDNTIFDVIQIRDSIIQDFEPRGNDLNFANPNLFIKKYFRQINVQGIFNRVEWKFCQRKAIKCELLMPGHNSRQKVILQIRVILEFLASKKQALSMLGTQKRADSSLSTDKKNSENFEIKVLLDFCADESKVEDAPTSTIPESSFNKIRQEVPTLKPALSR
ncbi:MAG: hypothetical protein DSM106950_21875 [Stigonema ocellatum SAG 48.90 = DSM 106950]|nr:hypothetical protein [Stigonema ocellatum SAG 48.90 = DSM 106950]